jgi:hypothetical protein
MKPFAFQSRTKSLSNNLSTWKSSKPQKDGTYRDIQLSNQLQHRIVDTFQFSYIQTYIYPACKSQNYRGGRELTVLVCHTETANTAHKGERTT